MVWPSFPAEIALAMNIIIKMEAKYFWGRDGKVLLDSQEVLHYSETDGIHVHEP